MPRIEIRNAIDEDAGTLTGFNIAMALETESKELPRDLVATGVTQMLSRLDLGFYLVAEVDGKVAGCLGITFEWSDWRNGLFWWIQSVYIVPEHRRKGVFRALYEHVIDMARGQASVCGVRLYVEKDNTNAQQTYQRLGMSETDYRLYEIEFD